MALVVCEASSHVQHDCTDLCRGSHSCSCFSGLYYYVNKCVLLISSVNVRADFVGGGATYTDRSFFSFLVSMVRQRETSF